MNNGFMIVSIEPRACPMLCKIAEGLGLFPPFEPAKFGIRGKIADNGYYVGFNPHEEMKDAILVADMFGMDVKFSPDCVIASNGMANAVVPKMGEGRKATIVAGCKAIMDVAEKTMKARGLIDADFERDFGMPPTRIAL